MKRIDEATAQARLDEIVSQVEHHPIVIRRGGKDVAAVVSVTDHQRLRLADIQSFLEIRKDAAREASASGLTEESLSELLAEGDH
jgi:PHD/YefM family antitoxin component YafN of YafNO toxin-antitoxin module